MPLHGRSILIIESEVAPFVVALQDAFERQGAETLVVCDPYAAKGLEHMKRFTFSAAVINAQHAGLAKLSVPTLVYGSTDTVDAIVVALRKLLKV